MGQKGRELWPPTRLSTCASPRPRLRRYRPDFTRSLVRWLAYAIHPFVAVSSIRLGRCVPSSSLYHMLMWGKTSGERHSLRFSCRGPSVSRIQRLTDRRSALSPASFRRRLSRRGKQDLLHIIRRIRYTQSERVRGTSADFSIGLDEVDHEKEF